MLFLFTLLTDKRNYARSHARTQSQSHSIMHSKQQFVWFYFWFFFSIVERTNLRFYTRKLVYRLYNTPHLNASLGIICLPFDVLVDAIPVLQANKLKYPKFVVVRTVAVLWTQYDCSYTNWWIAANNRKTPKNTLCNREYTSNRCHLENFHVVILRTALFRGQR